MDRVREKIVLTGAGGWLGTELLEFLLIRFGSEWVQDSVVCYGSRARNTTLSDGSRIRISEMKEVNSLPKDVYTGVVHLSFLTRGRVESMGFENYVSTNIKILSQAVELIQLAQPQWIATVSSGAVLDRSSSRLECDVVTNPYGFTKRIEEEVLGNLASSMGIHIAVGRLWGAMGRHMPINTKYAVSDFILQALKRQKITIESRHKVFRRYVDAAEFMNVLVESARRFPHTTFDSGGHLLEMQELAELVAASTNASVESRIIDDKAQIDDYYPSAVTYQHLCDQFSIPSRSLNDALQRTIESHREQLAQSPLNS